MAKLANKFNQAARDSIEDAIGRAEAQTAAEIVVVAAPDSGRYDRSEDTFGLLLAGVLMAAYYAIAPYEYEFAGLVTVMFLGYFAGVGIAMYLPPLRRLLTPRTMMMQETTRSAQAIAHQLEVNRSASRCGVLLYISFFERTASVIADKAVLDALTQDGINKLCAELNKRLHNTDATNAIVQVVEDAGRRLAEKLPTQPGDTNEIPNRFFVFD